MSEHEQENEQENEVEKEGENKAAADFEAQLSKPVHSDKINRTLRALGWDGEKDNVRVMDHAGATLGEALSVAVKAAVRALLLECADGFISTAIDEAQAVPVGTNAQSLTPEDYQLGRNLLARGAQLTVEVLEPILTAYGELHNAPKGPDGMVKRSLHIGELVGLKKLKINLVVGDGFLALEGLDNDPT